MADLGILCQLDERRVQLEPIDGESATSTRENSGQGNIFVDGGGPETESNNEKEEKERSRTREEGKEGRERDSRTEKDRVGRDKRNIRIVPQGSELDSVPPSPMGPLLSSAFTESPMPHTKTFVGYVTSVLTLIARQAPLCRICCHLV